MTTANQLKDNIVDAAAQVLRMYDGQKAFNPDLRARFRNLDDALKALLGENYADIEETHARDERNRLLRSPDGG